MSFLSTSLPFETGGKEAEHNLSKNETVNFPAVQWVRIQLPVQAKMVHLLGPGIKPTFDHMPQSN